MSLDAFPPILFDIDGTLVDSTDVVASVWRAVADQHGVDAEAILAVCHGRRDAEVVPEFFPAHAAATVFRQIAEAEPRYAHLLRPLPGAAALLNSLDDQAWAAVTSGPRALMTSRLRAAGLPVPAVLVTADDVAHGKPDPEGYLLAAKLLDRDIASCVVVEDAPAGIRAGRAAGARQVVGITTTHPATSLKAAGADTVIDNLAALRQAIG
ncbi:HAD-IA family hydrolase [Asanoa sp. WMMD1127]|uniref:HAD-IA family hydrolase n=1 Tax=Asanoa sp. WMMD1127 TaxID=3016107 RepID=UPI002417BBAD|nr:HAD-IA family hydrolase [Asanoa sp. WMMD1127]MDG4821675.1 HAD-IA family hydrolase [Asanoa sp. WMMD1127]